MKAFQSPAALLGLVCVVAMTVAALAAPVLAPHDPTTPNLEERLLPPTARYPLGTDHLGRDVLSRLLHGARTTLGLAGVVLAIVLTIALTIGLVSGYYGGWLDICLMGLTDLVLAFPRLILAIAVAGFLGPGLLSVLIGFATVWWASYARLIRGLVLTVRTRDYVEAGRAIGASDRRLLLGHVMPNILGPIVVLATVDVGWIVLSISGLNFLGLGAQPPTPEWGAMLNDGRPFLESAPRLLLYPGAALCLTALGFNLLGDGLRDLLDPTHRHPRD